MAWQSKVQDAVSGLRAEEKALQAQLAELQGKLAKLEEVGGAWKVKGKKAGKRLSAEGRAAISKAAKLRWRKYNAAKKAAAK